MPIPRISVCFREGPRVEGGKRTRIDIYMREVIVKLSVVIDNRIVDMVRSQQVSESSISLDCGFLDMVDFNMGNRPNCGYGWCVSHICNVTWLSNK